MTFDHALPLMAPQDPSKRVSIDDAMSHPWFSKRKPDGAEGLAVGGNNVREAMKEFNAKRAVLKLTNLRQRGRLSSVVEGAVDGVWPIAAIKNFMGGARPRAATLRVHMCRRLCDPACTPVVVVPIKDHILHTCTCAIAMSMCICACARARLHGVQADAARWPRRSSTRPVAEPLRRRRAGTRDDAAPPLPSRSRRPPPS